MNQDMSKSISIVAKRKIAKYAEGADPKVDEPFEVVEKEETLTGQEAINYLEQLKGGNSNAIR